MIYIEVNLTFEFGRLSNLAFLVSKTFNGVEFYLCRKDNVLRLWQYLLELLRARQLRLDLSLQLQRVFEEMMCTLEWMDEIKVFIVNLRALLFNLSTSPVPCSGS